MSRCHVDNDHCIRQAHGYNTHSCQGKLLRLAACAQGSTGAHQSTPPHMTQGLPLTKQGASELGEGHIQQLHGVWQGWQRAGQPNLHVHVDHLQQQLETGQRIGALVARPDETTQQEGTKCHDKCSCTPLLWNQLRPTTPLQSLRRSASHPHLQLLCIRQARRQAAAHTRTAGHIVHADQHAIGAAQACGACVVHAQAAEGTAFGDGVRNGPCGVAWRVEGTGLRVGTAVELVGRCQGGFMCFTATTLLRVCCGGWLDPL